MAEICRMAGPVRTLGVTCLVVDGVEPYGMWGQAERYGITTYTRVTDSLTAITARVAQRHAGITGGGLPESTPGVNTRSSNSHGTQWDGAERRRLRRKLGESADSPRYIFPEPRIGYRLGSPETPTEAAEASGRLHLRHEPNHEGS